MNSAALKRLAVSHIFRIFRTLKAASTERNLELVEGKCVAVSIVFGFIVLSPSINLAQ